MTKMDVVEFIATRYVICVNDDNPKGLSPYPIKGFVYEVEDASYSETSGVKMLKIKNLDIESSTYGKYWGYSELNFASIIFVLHNN